MPDATAPLGNATFTGAATVREIGPLGMISLRAAPDTSALAEAILAVAGTAVPGQRAILFAGGTCAAWMSPDEYLLVLPRADVPAALNRIAAALGAAHHLAVDVSDARSVFRIEGEAADSVIARLCPIDLPRLAEGELRRTRAAQVPCALWRADGGITLVAFRSVARYVFDLLANAAR
ncbi:MAG: sarcosine oxidase subunit gamma [Gemmobacter sp.]